MHRLVIAIRRKQQLVIFPAILLVCLLSGIASAQSAGDSSNQETSSSYLFGGIGGFIPLDESYRVNYSTNLGGLPIEVTGGFLFPVASSDFVSLTARYERRTANFVTNTSVAVFSIEPGFRFFLEPEREKDLRLFGAADVLLGQAFVQGVYDMTQYDVTSSSVIIAGSAMAEKDYLDLGFGFDLGLTYPFTPTTALDAMVHLAVYVTSPVLQGGLGNVGGVSLTAAYRFGF